MVDEESERATKKRVLCLQVMEKTWILKECTNKKKRLVCSFYMLVVFQSYPEEKIPSWSVAAELTWSDWLFRPNRWEREWTIVRTPRIFSPVALHDLIDLSFPTPWPWSPWWRIICFARQQNDLKGTNGKYCRISEHILHEHLISMRWSSSEPRCFSSISQCQLGWKTLKDLNRSTKRQHQLVREISFDNRLCLFVLQAAPSQFSVSHAADLPEYFPRYHTRWHCSRCELEHFPNDRVASLARTFSPFDVGWINRWPGIACRSNRSINWSWTTKLRFGYARKNTRISTRKEKASRKLWKKRINWRDRFTSTGHRFEPFLSPTRHFSVFVTGEKDRKPWRSSFKH